VISAAQASLWFPATYRASILGWFMFAIPISTVIGSPISGFSVNRASRRVAPWKAARPLRSH
jgi:hypothetical protein